MMIIIMSFVANLRELLWFIIIYIIFIIKKIISNKYISPLKRIILIGINKYMNIKIFTYDKIIIGSIN